MTVGELVELLQEVENQEAEVLMSIEDEAGYVGAPIYDIEERNNDKAYIV